MSPCGLPEHTHILILYYHELKRESTDPGDRQESVFEFSGAKKQDVEKMGECGPRLDHHVGYSHKQKQIITTMTLRYLHTHLPSYMYSCLRNPYQLTYIPPPDLLLIFTKHRPHTFRFHNRSTPMRPPSPPTHIEIYMLRMARRFNPQLSPPSLFFCGT